MRNQNDCCVISVLLSKFQSNLSIIDKVITILTKFNNLTDHIKVKVKLVSKKALSHPSIV